MQHIKAVCGSQVVSGLLLRDAAGWEGLSDELGGWRTPDDLRDPVEVFDRDGRGLSPVERRSSEWVFAEDDLASHFSRPILLGQHSAGPSSRRRALSLLRQALEPDSGGRLDALCGPWIDEIPGLVDDAAATRRNDPEAYERLHDALRGLAGRARVAGVHAQSTKVDSDRVEDSAVAAGATDGDEAPFDAIGETLTVVLAGLAARPSSSASTFALVRRLVSSADRFDAIMRDFTFGELTRLRAEQHLRLLEFECGPDDGPLPDLGDGPPNDPFGDPESSDRARCAIEAYRTVSDLEREYAISSVEPQDACAGEDVTLRGEGFGTERGVVVIGAFRIVPNSWSDTEIQLTLPAGVSSALVILDILIASVMVCDHLIDVKARPRFPLAVFAGGEPSVALSVTPSRALPGEKLAVTWSTISPGPVRLAIPTGASPPAAAYTVTEVGRNGSINYKVPSETSTKTFTFMASVTTRCGFAQSNAKVVVHRTASVSVTGIEITQGVQHLDAGEPNHLQGTALQNVGDNSLALIARKRTMVRVYLECDQDPGFNGGIVQDALVTLFAYRNDEVPGVLVGKKVVDVDTAGRLATVESRRNNNSTTTSVADFAVPLHLVDGSTPISFGAMVSLDQESLDLVDHQRTSTRSDLLKFVSKGAPTLVLVRVNLTNSAHVQPPPAFATQAQRQVFFSQLNRIRARLPFADLEFRVPEPRDAVLNFSGRLDRATASSGCDDAWPDLLDELEDLSKDYDSGGTIWVGLLNTLPPGARTGGCGNTSGSGRGVAAFPIDAPNSGAHEIAHTFGIGHVDDTSKSDGKAFPNYGYTPPPPARQSCGEYGVDADLFVSNGTLSQFSPQTTSDWMNSSGNGSAGGWTSPYMWQRFELGGVSGGAGVIAVDEPIVSEPREMLHVFGRLNPASGRVRLRRLFHLPRRSVGPGREYDTGYRIVLIDAHGNDVFSHAVTSRSDPPRNPLRIGELIPFDPDATALEVRDPDGTVLCRRERPDDLVTVDSISAEITSSGVDLRWHGSRRYLYGLAASRDDGQSWWRVLKGVRGSRITVPSDEIGAGRIMLRLIATDGFNTKYYDIPDLDLGEPPSPEVAIVDVSMPLEGQWRLSTNSSLPFGIELADVEQRLSWTIEGETLGAGSTLVTNHDLAGRRVGLQLDDLEIDAVDIPAQPMLSS